MLYWLHEIKATVTIEEDPLSPRNDERLKDRTIKMTFKISKRLFGIAWCSRRKLGNSGEIKFYSPFFNKFDV